MLLFIHDIGETKSFWLQQIRGVLSLGPQYSDMYIINIFTLALPGHSFKDKVFDWLYMNDKINNFIEDKKDAQHQLADELVQSHNPEIIKVLREDGLTLVGHGLGGAIISHYAIEYPEKSNRLITIDSSTKFYKLSLLFLQLRYWYWGRFSLSQLLDKAKQVKSKKASALLSILSDSTTRLGINSALKMMKEYDLLKTLESLPEEKQVRFASIPTLSINSEISPFVSLSNTRKLQIKLNNTKSQVEAKKAIVNNKRKPYQNYKIIIEEGCFINPHQKDNISFTYNMRKFLKDNLRLK